MPRPTRVWRSWALGLCLTGLSAGCSEPEASPKPASASASDTLQVATVTLQPATIERHYETSGTLQARRSAELVASEPGIIRHVAVQEGDVVEPRQVLARLDGRALALEAAAAELEARNLALELQRLQSAPSGVIPREEIDKQRYAVEEAEVRARLSGVQARNSVVRAPFAGTIVQRYIDEGNLATTTTPLFSLADLSALELELHLPERDALRVADDAMVELSLVDDTRFEARVTRRAPIVDPVTGTVKLTVSTSTSPEHAVPGAYVRAQLLLERAVDVPSLPRQAVFFVEGRPHVYAIDDGRAHRTPVQVGIEGPERIQILEGLQGDAPVVRDGNAGITEGMPLRSAPPEGDTPLEG